MPQTVSPLDILTSGGSHPERERSDECTTEVRINAADLAERVSKLLDSLGSVGGRATISSGFRTSAANRQVGGSKNSAHCEGRAVDLADPKGALAAAITRDVGILATFDLYLEHPDYTKGWVHLSTRGPLSGRRVFVP